MEIPPPQCPSFPFIPLIPKQALKDAKEKVQVIRENLKMAQMRQKSYHDKGTAP
jgi:hypothetical protein